MLLICLSTVLYVPVSCDIKPPTTFQTQNGIRSAHAITQAASSWATNVRNAAKAASAASEAASNGADAAAAAAKAAQKAAKEAGKCSKQLT